MDIGNVAYISLIMLVNGNASPNRFLSYIDHRRQQRVWMKPSWLANRFQIWQNTSTMSSSFLKKRFAQSDCRSWCHIFGSRCCMPSLLALGFIKAAEALQRSSLVHASRKFLKTVLKLLCQQGSYIVFFDSPAWALCVQVKQTSLSRVCCFADSFSLAPLRKDSFRSSSPEVFKA